MVVANHRIPCPVLIYTQFDCIPTTADAQYLRVLHLAATTAESEVEAALGLLADAKRVPTLDAVRDLVRSPHIAALVPSPVNLQQYDTLLESRRIAQ